jgi:hypothetical protein
LGRRKIRKACSSCWQTLGRGRVTFSLSLHSKIGSENSVTADPEIGSDGEVFWTFFFCVYREPPMRYVVGMERILGLIIKL